MSAYPTGIFNSDCLYEPNQMYHSQYFLEIEKNNQKFRKIAFAKYKMQYHVLDS